MYESNNIIQNNSFSTGLFYLIAIRIGHFTLTLLEHLDCVSSEALTPLTLSGPFKSSFVINDEAVDKMAPTGQ